LVSQSQLNSSALEERMSATHRASGRLPRLVIAALLLAVTGCVVAGQHATDATRAVAGYTFPPEWQPREAIWLGWAGREPLHRVQVEMIQAMPPHVRIRLMVTSDNARTQAASALDAAGIERDRVEFCPGGAERRRATGGRPC
jgi:hypothetical protein